MTGTRTRLLGPCFSSEPASSLSPPFIKTSPATWSTRVFFFEGIPESHLIPLLLSTVVTAFSIISFPPPCLSSTFHPGIFSITYTQNQIRLLFCLKISSLFLVELCYPSSLRSVTSTSSPTFPTSQHACAHHAHTHACTYMQAHTHP